MRHAFGQGEPFRIGIEDELFLLDDDGALAPVAADVLARLDLPEGLAGHELFASEIELRSPPSRTVAEAVEALRRGRAAVAGLGATPLAAGLHPLDPFGDNVHTDLPRYAAVGNELRGLLHRTPECALHVHVGMPDAETAIKVCNGMRTHLPLLAGLAANSPYWHGIDAGMASARAAMVRAYPGRGVPRAYRDLDDYEHALETTLRAAGMADRTQLWWDVRPHAALGTVEIREMDAQTELRDVVPIAALVHCLVRYEAERGSPVFIPRDALDWSSFRAARDGLDAEILDEDARVRPLREVARTLLSQLVMVAGELDCGDALEEVDRLLEEGNGADRQRAEHARSGMDGLVRSLRERTLA
jgi:glutamate---cysteine ligase / carboxylate-amine ligase